MSKVRLFNDLPHVWDVKTDGVDTTRAAGVRHEIEIDGDNVTFREAWYFSDNGEIHQVTERTIELNKAVHLMVNITDAECTEIAEVRTTRPNDNATPDKGAEAYVEVKQSAWVRIAEGSESAMQKAWEAATEEGKNARIVFADGSTAS